MATNAATTVPNVPAPSPPAQFQLADDDLAILRAAIPEKAKEREADIVAFWQELPRLLAEDQEGRCALVHDGQVVSVWDTLGDATQAGYDKYGIDGRFSTPIIKELELLRLRQFLAQQRGQPCPS
jgi:hypothetical protein